LITSSSFDAFFFNATILRITMMMLRSSTPTPLQTLFFPSFFYYNKNASQWTPHCSMDQDNKTTMMEVQRLLLCKPKQQNNVQEFNSSLLYMV
jgi:hypothetical protein